MGLWDLPTKEIDSICFFQNCGILPKIRQCSNSHNMKLDISQNRVPMWKCTEPDCLLSIHLRLGSWLEDSKNKISFTTAVRFIYCWSREFTTAKFCDEELDMQADCALHWNSKLRDVCAIVMHKEKSRINEMLNYNWDVERPFMKHNIDSYQDRASYAAEYTWRKVQAEKEMDCFDAILESIVSQYPPEIENKTVQLAEWNIDPALKMTVVDNDDIDPALKMTVVDNDDIDPALKMTLVDNDDIDPALRMTVVEDDIEIKSEPKSDPE